MVIAFFLISKVCVCNHPLMLCLILILLAASISVIRRLIILKWITYAIVLIFLGGMIIIFIYVTTLAGNEKFSTASLTRNFLTFLTIARLAVVFTISPLSAHTKEFFMSHIYFRNSSRILWFLILFLFMTLVIVVKLAESFKGALVKFS